MNATCDPLGALAISPLRLTKPPFEAKPAEPLLNTHGDPVTKDPTMTRAVPLGVSNDGSATTTGSVSRSAMSTLPAASTARPDAPLRPLDTSVRTEPVQSSCLSDLVAGSKK